MTRYIVQRVVMLIPVLIGISVVIFSMLRLIPGDPATVMPGEHATPEQIEDFRERTGLDDPIYIQYLRYLQGVLRGDLGRSSVTKEWVIVELGQRLPATMELTLGAMFVACTVGIIAGVIAAYYHNSFFDLVTMVGALIGVSMPIFWLGLILMYIFSFKLKWLPPSARMTVGVDLQTLNEAYHLDQIFSGAWGAKIIAFTHFLSEFYVLASILTGNWKALLDVLKHLVHHRPHDPFQPFGGVGRGLYPHGSGQGFAGKGRSHRARHEKRLPAYRYRDRVTGRRALEGGYFDGNHLFLAGHGPTGGQSHPGPRLSLGTGQRAGYCPGLCLRQFDGGHILCLPGSAHSL
jgi:ABC-type dipeptide/oligopeptide/nickel transport system permease component